MIKRVKKVSLCLGRHNMPVAVDGSIFPTKVDPLNVNGLEKEAFYKIHELIANNCVEELHLYVTGLSVALLAVINAWKTYKKCATNNRTRLVCFHYDYEANMYYEQHIVE